MGGTRSTITLVIPVLPLLSCLLIGNPGATWISMWKMAAAFSLGCRANKWRQFSPLLYIIHIVTAWVSHDYHTRIMQIVTWAYFELMARRLTSDSSSNTLAQAMCPSWRAICRPTCNNNWARNVPRHMSHITVKYDGEITRVTWYALVQSRIVASLAYFLLGAPMWN